MTSAHVPILGVGIHPNPLKSLMLGSDEFLHAAGRKLYVSAIELDIRAGQTVVEEQANDSGDSDVEINGSDPIVAIGLEPASELADLTPILEIVVGISTFFERDNFGKLSTEQREGPLSSYNADCHIMLVENKHIAVQSRM